MILRGLVASPPVQGVTVQDPIDLGAPQGWSPVGMGGYWTANPSPNFALSNLGTPTAGAVVNLDWGTGGYFTVTMPASGTSTFQFATTATAALAAAAQTQSFDLGQLIVIQVTGTAGVTVAWPTTITWVGVIATPAVSNAAPVLTGAGVTTLIWLVCTGTGSAPTFTGFYITN